MDATKHKDIILYTNCDELPMYNFRKIQKGNYGYLIQGYNGFSKVNLPDDYQQVWLNIINEYETLTDNPELSTYYELLIDIEDAVIRIEIATTLLYQLDVRPDMDIETQSKYIKELLEWRFYINTAKPLKSELEAKQMQLKAARMKLSQKQKEKERIEQSNKGNMPFQKLLQRVDTLRGMNTNLKEISVSYWVYLLEDISKNKKTAA